MKNLDIIYIGCLKSARNYALREVRIRSVIKVTGGQSSEKLHRIINQLMENPITEEPEHVEFFFTAVIQRSLGNYVCPNLNVKTYDVSVSCNFDLQNSNNSS